MHAVVCPFSEYTSPSPPADGCRKHSVVDKNQSWRWWWCYKLTWRKYYIHILSREDLTEKIDKVQMGIPSFPKLILLRLYSMLSHYWAKVFAHLRSRWRKKLDAYETEWQTDAQDRKVVNYFREKQKSHPFLDINLPYSHM